ncbi:hypothetical protein [Limnofasciculus baicalensis]|uniref:Lipoprotein n=1 Tax=Limnofasciculus baicalensis BBK-W-15 TaxID=2699891 RepID=A0AAE3GUV2_9CYAN|nr:hypothetical protein [Limnofasciculus baicalensis]MCP2729007.1 hypothetical protein [Limnofasciculus baicalensis BBK-W-15]
MKLFRLAIPLALSTVFFACAIPNKTVPSTEPSTTSDILPSAQLKQLLTKAEADKLMTGIVDSINQGNGAFVLPYLPESKRSIEFGDAGITDYKTYFNNEPISRFELVKAEDSGEFINQASGKFYYLLYNKSGVKKEIAINQESGNIRLGDEFFQYSYPAKVLLAKTIQAIKTEDPVLLAKVLTADDIDYPVAKAKDAIAKYRATFDPNTLAYRFDGLDKNRHFNYTIYGTKAGKSVEHHVTIIYGDSLVGLQDKFIP